MTVTKSAERVEIHKTDSRGRVRLPRDKQEALLDEFERSAMSGVEFAAWAGVKYPTFAHWRQKRRQQRTETPAMVPMKWAEAVMAPEPERTGAGLAIHLPCGVRVEAGTVRAAAELLRELGVVRC